MVPFGSRVRVWRGDIWWTNGATRSSRLPRGWLVELGKRNAQLTIVLYAPAGAKVEIEQLPEGGR